MDGEDSTIVPYGDSQREGKLSFGETYENCPEIRACHTELN